jgi:hypothetical protein
MASSVARLPQSMAGHAGRGPLLSSPAAGGLPIPSLCGTACRHRAADSPRARPQIREVRRPDRGCRPEEPRGGGHDASLQAAALTWLASQPPVQRIVVRLVRAGANYRGGVSLSVLHNRWRTDFLRTGHRYRVALLVDRILKGEKLQA